eukprot:3941936-Rhodomonas_salina.2
MDAIAEQSELLLINDEVTSIDGQNIPVGISAAQGTTLAFPRNFPISLWFTTSILLRCTGSISRRCYAFATYCPVLAETSAITA